MLKLKNVSKFYYNKGMIATGFTKTVNCNPTFLDSTNHGKVTGWNKTNNLENE